MQIYSRHGFSIRRRERLRQVNPPGDLPGGIPAVVFAPKEDPVVGQALFD
jgi:hypothetical protein